jgi:two-component system LytT family sensor kinase
MQIDMPIAYLTLQAVGFATGTVLCWLMAALLWKSGGPLPDNGLLGLQASRTLRVAMPLAGSLWPLGSFAMQIILLLGLPMQSPAFGWAFLIAWTSIFIMPSMWLRIRDQASKHKPRFRRALLAMSTAIAIALTAALTASLLVRGFPLKPESIMILSAYNTILHAVVILFAYRWQRSSVAARSVAKVVAPLVAVQMGMIFAMIYFQLSRSVLLALGFVAQQGTIPNVIVVAGFVAKFRYADVLLKRSLNLMLSVVASTCIAWFIPGIPQGIPLVVASLAGAALLMATPSLYSLVSRIVDRAFLRRPDYSALVRTCEEASARAANETELFDIAEKTVRMALHPELARVAPVQESVVLGTAEHILIKAVRGDFVLLVSPAIGGRRLLKEEMVFLQAIAAEIGRRLDALDLERERQSLIEAELKALRAQVDPHFLFNTLNTIADLITSHPSKAEMMTERLAEFFRYTLSRTDRTLTTLAQEFQFVRDYLDIEQVRFGDRLRFDLSAGPDVAQEMVPALILQPMVENAIRHGLAPKPEGGSISVSASREGAFVRVEVADDGVGIRNGSARGAGIGLENVRKRLHALYGDTARMKVDSRVAHGTCVSLLLPSHGR